jgi:hypothetical protein
MIPPTTVPALPYASRPRGAPAAALAHAAHAERHRRSGSGSFIAPNQGGSTLGPGEAADHHAGIDPAYREEVDRLLRRHDRRRPISINSSNWPISHAWARAPCGRIYGHDLARHQPVEQMTNRGQLLLDGRGGNIRAAALRLDPGGDVQRLHGFDGIHAGALTPGHELGHDAAIGTAGVPVADVGVGGGFLILVVRAVFVLAEPAQGVRRF